MNKTFFTVWFARLISILGSSLTTFGVSVWIFEETGKATPMVITLMCSILPSIIFAPLSGIICDYFNRKRIIIFADSVAAITSIMLFMYLINGEFKFWIICFFTFFSATANMFDNNAYQASLSTMVSDSELKRANGMNQIVDSVGSILAPVAAGILYVPLRLRGLIVIDILTYIISMILFVKVSDSYFYSHDGAKKDSGNALENVSAGFRFIFSQKGLSLLLIFFTLFNFLINVPDSLTEPLGLSVGGSIFMGVLKMCGGAGVLCGSLFITVKAVKKSYSKGIFWASIIAGIGIFIMGVRNNIYTIIIGEFLFLFVSPIVNTIAGTLWILKTPKELQGRVYAARSMVARLVIPVAYFLAGPLVDEWIPDFLEKKQPINACLNLLLGAGNISYRFVYVMSGLIIIICAISFWTNKNMRKL